jgi:hypothetical protein
MERMPPTPVLRWLVASAALATALASCSTGAASPDATGDGAIDTGTPSADVVEAATADAVGDAAPSDGPPLDAAPADVLRGVGDPCTSDTECAAGDCLREADFPGLYPGGYCTRRNCGLPDGGSSCPAGSLCMGGGAISSSGCFVECSPPSRPCRTGYICLRMGDAAVGVCWRTLPDAG